MKNQLNAWAVKFFLGNAIFCWLIALRDIYIITPLVLTYNTVFNKILVWVFFIFATLGHMSLLAFLPYLLFVLPLLYCYPKPHIIISSAVLLACIGLFWLIIDSFVFAHSRFHLNGVIMHMVLSRYMQSIFNLSWIEWAEILFLAFAILIIEYYLALFCWRKTLPGTSRLPKNSINYSGRLLSHCL